MVSLSRTHPYPGHSPFRITYSKGSVPNTHNTPALGTRRSTYQDRPNPGQGSAIPLLVDEISQPSLYHGYGQAHESTRHNTSRQPEKQMTAIGFEFWVQYRSKKYSQIMLFSVRFRRPSQLANRVRSAGRPSSRSFRSSTHSDNN